MALVVHRLLGQILGQLHIRLVKWIDAEHRTGRRHGEFPAEKLLADIMLIGQIDLRHRVAVGLQGSGAAVEFVIAVVCQTKINKKTVASVSFRRRQTFIGHRHDTFIFLARTLGDQLFGPRRGMPQARANRRKVTLSRLAKVSSPNSRA